MKITSPETLASTLKDARKQSMLTQKALAEQVGAKQATISTFENHPDNCRVETLFRLLAALNLEIQITERDQPDRQTGWDQEW